VKEKTKASLLRVVDRLGTKIWFDAQGSCSRTEGPYIIYAIINTKNRGESWWRDGEP